MTNRKILFVAISVNALALAALLTYSIERTMWLFNLFENWTVAAGAAAVVVELAAVALLVGAGALSHLDETARAWANRALVAVLSVQALANLSAGYLRGGRTTLALFAGDNADASYAVAATLWFAVNLAVPGLILCLSKLLERLLIAHQTHADLPFRLQVDALRTDYAQLMDESAALRSERDRALEHSAQTRLLVDREGAQSAQVRNELEQVRHESAKGQDELEAARTRSAKVARENETLQAMVRDQAGAVDHLSAENAALSAAAAIDVRIIAQTLRSHDVPLRTIGEALRVSEKTIRNWTADVRTNGHVTEEAS